MPSRIDATLSPQERRVLSLYTAPGRSGIGRAVRLSVQYALGAGVFVVLCLREHEPLWVLPVYGLFLLVLAVRLIGARAISGVMPGVIAKYEARIAELEGASAPSC